MRAAEVAAWAGNNWPFIVAIATGAAATTGWVVNVLRVRELRYQLDRLRWEAAERERRIHIPTNDEVRTFGKPRSGSKLTIAGTLLFALLMLTGGGIALRHLGVALRTAREAELRERLQASSARAEVVQLRETLTQVLAHPPNDRRPSGPSESDRGGKGQGPPPAGGSAGIFPLIDLEKEPRLLYFLTPPFPVEPIMGRTRNVIVVSVLVDQAGQVLAAEVVSQVPSDVATEVEKALRKWRYTPGESKAGPVATRILQAVALEPITPAP